MKKFISNKAFILAAGLLAISGALTAQSTRSYNVTDDQKGTYKVTDDKKKDVQEITISRSGNKDEKLVVEVIGDKVLINGKDVKEMKDVSVNISNYNGVVNFRHRNGNNNVGGFSTSFDNFDNFNIISDSIFIGDNKRAMLGVNTASNDAGAEISSVTKESAAAKAGLKKGDVITKIAESKIETTSDLTDAVRAHKPGDKVVIGYLRGGKAQTTTAELGSWMGINIASVTAPSISELTLWKDASDRTARTVIGYQTNGRPKLGLSIQDTDDSKGVKILEVDDESAAEKAGLKKDDIILAVDDKEVKETTDVTSVIKANKDKYNYTFKIQRDGKTQNVEVKLPKRLKTTDL